MRTEERGSASGGKDAAVAAARAVARWAADKKAEDIRILDMRPVANFCDCFVICSGTSSRHVAAIADGIEEGVVKQGLGSARREGTAEAGWILIDMGDIVVHVFEKGVREFYGLELLWQEAPSRSVDDV